MWVLSLIDLCARDGEMAAGDPVPCASVPGTTFVVEDLFYNSSTRRQVGYNASLVCIRCDVKLSLFQQMTDVCGWHGSRP